MSKKVKNIYSFKSCVMRLQRFIRHLELKSELWPPLIFENMVTLANYHEMVTDHWNCLQIAIQMTI